MEDRTTRTKSALWPIPLMCLGLGLIAACVLLPQSESNKKLEAERAKLQHDLKYVQTELSVNDEFLNRVAGDAGLSERLAQRQMQSIRKGSAVLKLRNRPDRLEVSPFQLLSIAAPPSPAPYRAPTGFIGHLSRSPRCQLYAAGLGMFMIAISLVLGSSNRS